MGSLAPAVPPMVWETVIGSLAETDDSATSSHFRSWNLGRGVRRVPLRGAAAASAVGRRLLIGSTLLSEGSA